jgi:uncharacterized protein
MIMTNPNAVELLRKSFDRFMAKDMRGWADLCAPDVVAEFPFARPHHPNRFEGREALFDYLRGYPETIDVQSMPTMRIYATEDANVAVAEWSVSGCVLSNGKPYEMSYATFVTLRDGALVNSASTGIRSSFWLRWTAARSDLRPGCKEDRLHLRHAELDAQWAPSQTIQI